MNFTDFYFVSGTFIRSGQHNHPIEGGAGLKAKVKAIAIAKARTDFLTPASQLVDSALKEVGPDPREILPNLNYLIRCVNRVREKYRPKHPRTLDFILDLDNVPENFIREDISANGQRYLILCSDKQLELLANAKVIYFDATFKSAKEPFKQLASIHSFIKSEGKMKQVPLAFIIMSRRQTVDYTTVLEAIFKLLPTKSKVKEVVLDFERAMWSAFKKVLPANAKLHGCWFHWSQAMYRKIKDAKLRRQYAKQGAIRTFLKMLMALPHLPAEHIPEAFNCLNNQPIADRKLKK